MSSPSPSQLPTARDRLVAALAELRGMSEVEAIVGRKLASEAPLLTEIPRYLLELGGKRMRPILALLTGRLCGLTDPSPALLDVAAGIELIHMATLLHDDIIDRSPLRRHQASPYVKFGLENTLLSGDFLLVRAFSLCARLDSFIIDSTEQACIELTEGEILEVPLSRAEHTCESSLTIARKKTAALFWLAARSGAHLAGAPVAAVEALSRFGDRVGTAFQVLDDILDVTSPEDLLGKKSGIDLRERKPSLVNVLWVESGSPLARRLTTPEPLDEEFIAAALAELRGSPVIEAARGEALRLVAEGTAALEQALAALPTPDRHAAEALRALVAYILERME